MTDLTPLDGPRRAPSGGDPTKSIVLLLHGYGADGNDLIGLADYWQKDFPETLFLAPHAPERCELSPFGRQWFSLDKYDPDLQRRDPKAGAQVFELMREGVEQARRNVDQFLQTELERCNLSMRDVGFVGFSQGTMVSLFTGLRENVAPAGILGYSGAMISASRLSQEITFRPPVCLVHGEQDDVVPFTAMGACETALKDAGIAVTSHSRPGLGHGIDEGGLDIGRHFLMSIFANI